MDKRIIPIKLKRDIQSPIKNVTDEMKLLPILYRKVVFSGYILCGWGL